MADNVIIADKNGDPATIATKDVGGVEFQVAMLANPDGSVTTPATDAGIRGVNAKTLSDVVTTLLALATALGSPEQAGATKPISASSLPLPTGAATSANQTSANSSLSSIDRKLPELSAGKVPVTDPTALPLPTGAATSAKQDTLATKLDTLHTDLGTQLPAGLGQKAASASLPGILAADQPQIPTSWGNGGILIPQTTETLITVSDTIVATVQPGLPYSFCLQIPVNTAGGTFTVIFEGWNGSTWGSINVTPKTLLSGTGLVSSASAIGLWEYTPPAGITQVRLRLSAISGLAGGLRGYIDSMSQPFGLVNLPFIAGLTADITTATWCVPPIDMDGLCSPVLNLGAFTGTSQVLTGKSSGVVGMTPTTNATNCPSINIASTTAGPGSTVTAASEAKFLLESRYFGIAITHTAITAFTVYGCTARVGYAPAFNAVGLAGAGTPTINPTAATASGGVSTFHKLISAATTNATSVKASNTSLNKAILSNNGASAAYWKIYNKASAPTVGTDTPVAVVMIPAGQTVIFSPALYERYTTGFAYAITGGIADTDTTAVAANQVSVSLSYA